MEGAAREYRLQVHRFPEGAGFNVRAVHGKSDVLARETSHFGVHYNAGEPVVGVVLFNDFELVAEDEGEHSYRKVRRLNLLLLFSRVNNWKNY